MIIREAIHVLLGEGRKLPLLTHQDLRKLFYKDRPAAFAKGLGMLVDIGLLDRITRNVYLNRVAPDMGFDAIGRIVRYVRPGHLSYLSYESALAEHGSINQVPIVSTFATTGPSGRYSTRYGVIELTHTNRSARKILSETAYEEYSDSFLASPTLALEDLKRSRPHMFHLVDDEYHREAMREWDEAA